MPARIYSEDNIKKRKILSGDEKPTRKYTKTIKEEPKEIKTEPVDSDGDIDDDDVMDIEEADGTLPKKGKQGVKAQKRVVKTKQIKKIKDASEKEGKDGKPKPKRKKKMPVPPTTPTVDNTSPANTSKVTTPGEPSKIAKKVPKIKTEKKSKPKIPKPAKKPEKDDAKPMNDSDSGDSSPEESDAYETCGVLNCMRPSGEFKRLTVISATNIFHFLSLIESVQDWILCDGGCEIWYHMVCVGLRTKEVKPDFEFICNNCKSSDTKSLQK